jgi:hypothetical protein
MGTNYTLKTYTKTWHTTCKLTKLGIQVLHVCPRNKVILMLIIVIYKCIKAGKTELLNALVDLDIENIDRLKII